MTNADEEQVVSDWKSINADINHILSILAASIEFQQKNKAKTYNILPISNT